MFVAMETFA